MDFTCFMADIQNSCVGSSYTYLVSFSTCFSTSVVQEPHAIASSGCLTEILVPGAQFRTTKSVSMGLGPSNKPVNKCLR